MKVFRIASLAASAVLLAAACTKPSKGDDAPILDPTMLPSRTLTIGDYTKVMNADSKCAIRIRYSSDIKTPTLYSSKTNQNYFKYEVTDGTLKMFHDNGGEVFFLSGSSFVYLPVNPGLKELSTSGPVVFVNQFKGTDLKLSATKGGSVKGDFSLSGTLDASANGGEFFLTGLASTLELSVQGGSFGKANSETAYRKCSFLCSNADIDIEGYASLSCLANMVGTVRANGTVDYTGECNATGVIVENGGNLNKLD